MKQFDLTFVGTGPSAVFAVLKLLENGYSGNILMVDKGKSLSTRQSNEVLNGFAGAGCFSDSKLSSALDVGGTIPGLSQEKLDEYSDYILTTLNYFKQNTQDKTSLKWDTTTPYDTKDTSLIWDIHKLCHIGTECGQAIYYEIEKYLTSKPNVTILFETTVEDISYIDGNYSFCINGDIVITKKLILATGQKDALPGKIIRQFNLKSIPRAFQLGIRVVDERNNNYDDIIKANYDFKFIRTYNYDNNISVRVRTFCCNSGNAHVCAERANEGFTCFNGHSYKTPDPNNNSVNYGIICEVNGLNDYKFKEDQIELMKKINSISTWEEDNFRIIEEEPQPKRYLTHGFPHLMGYYPDEVITSLEKFIIELNNLVDLSKAKYLYPEVKLSGVIPNLNYKTFETEQKNLYMIGDCAISRGIIKSSITGIMLAEELNN